MFYFALTNKLVSIHAPTWGATCPHRASRTVADVSIHAPTWGATSGLSVTIARIHVSIHALTRGATNVSLFSCSQSMFQSTHPLGVRQLLCDVSFTHSVVSIHAPTRGATEEIQEKQRIARVSIHAPTRGATYGFGKDFNTTMLFQSTHPLGVRRRSAGGERKDKCFNPRTHSGCDTE